MDLDQLLLHEPHSPTPLRSHKMASAGASSSTASASQQLQDTAPSSASPRPKTDKRRAANLLRDYYGLSSDTNSNPQSSSTSEAGNAAIPSSSDTNAGSKIDLQSLLRSNSLSVLLAKESELIVQIRELDGERQSLVYNHHHELVAASDTIRNMKQKSESLDPSLESLKSSFETMSSLSSNLEVLRKPSLEASRDPDSNSLDPLRDLEPIVSLPATLSDMIECRLDSSSSPAKQLSGEPDENIEARKAGLAKAEHLWGTMEPVLAAWTDAGVAGVREIAAECRALLKDGRKALGASNGTGTRLS